MKNKTLILAAFVCVFIISIFLVFSNYWKWGETGNRGSSPKNPDKDLQEAPYYKDIDIEKIYLDSDASVYSLKNGEFFKDGVKLQSENDKEKIERVLRLALFYQWMKEDPLFASSTLNIDAFAQSVETLKKEQDKFFKKYNTENSVFALNFLEKFIESSKSYNKFKNEVSEKNAKEAIEKSEMANRVYYKEADSLIKSIKGLSLGEKEELNRKKFVDLAGDTYTTIKIVLSDLDIIKENSEFAGREIDERKKCFFESLKSCRRPMESFFKPEQPNDSRSNFDQTPVLLTKDELHFDKNINYGGPYKINSPCWQNRNEQYLYVSKQCAGRLNHCSEESHLGTNIYFRALVDSVPFEKFLKEKGVQLIARSATTPYACMNLEYQPSLAALNYFYAEFKDDKLFQRIKEREKFNNYPEEAKKIIDEGKAAESLFFDAQYPSEDSLKYLGNFYGFAYAYFTENDIGSPEEREEFLKKYLLIREKMSDMELVLNKITDYFAGALEAMALYEAIPNPLYIYPIRSNYSVFFLAFSPTIWRIDKTPRYLTRDTEFYKKSKASFEEAVDYKPAIAKYGKESIDKWMEIYNQSKKNDFKLAP